MTNSLVDKCPVLRKYVEGNPSAYTGEIVYLDTRSMMGYCVPKYEEMKGVAEQLYAQMDKSTGGSMSRYIVDLMEAWPVILASAFIAFVVSVLFLYLLQWTAKFMIYGSMFGVLGFGILLTAFLALEF